MDDTTKEFVKTVIAGQLRHVLTGAATALVTHGAMQADQSGAFVEIASGIAMYGIGAGWSWWQKTGQALLAAKLARLRRNVAAIPTVPAATQQAIQANAAVALAKEI